MAFSSGGSSVAYGRFGSRRFRGIDSLSEMNVVPLVDVVLVLLIIFMLAAQAIETGLQVDVPTVKHTEESTKELPVVTVSSDGKVFLGDASLNLNLIPPQIKSNYAGTQAVYVQADRRVTYDTLAQVVSTLKGAGLQINLVMQPLESPRK
jgi:biopolymer transport protein TolR